MPMISNNAPTATMRDVMATVLEFYPQITRDDLVSPSRKRKFVGPRWLAMSLARELGGQSLTRIGMVFNRDHTTVLHALRRIQAMVELDADLELTRTMLMGRIMLRIEGRRDAMRAAVMSDTGLRPSVKQEILTSEEPHAIA